MADPARLRGTDDPRARVVWRLCVCALLQLVLTGRAGGQVTAEEILALGGDVPGVGILRGFTPTLCFGADGRVGAGVTSADGQQALTCGDATGFSALARQGDPSPRGGVFVEFRDCAMSSDGSVYFAATRRLADEWPTLDVYRATPQGIEWIVGADTRASDGTWLERLDTLDNSNVPGSPVFAVNDRGTVLVRASSANGLVLARIRRGAAPEALRAVFGTGQSWIYGNRDDAGLADDDAVLALGTVVSGEPAVLALEPEHIDVRFTLADILTGVGVADPINPALYRMIVRGQRFGFQLEWFTAPSEWHRRFVIYRPEQGFGPLLDPSPYDDLWVVDFTASGRALIAGIVDRPYPNYTDNLVLDEAGLQLISHDLGRPLACPNVLALNDRGNVLLQTWTTPESDQRRSLLRSGPTPDASVRCFVPPTAVAPTPRPTETPTIAPTRTERPTPTPVDCVAQPDACAHVQVGGATGAPGDHITIAVTLGASPRPVVALQADLLVPFAAAVAETTAGDPACQIDPGIDKPDSRFVFAPRCDTCTDVRALVLAFDNLDPIPAGTSVFRCDLTVAADAAPGTYSLTAASVVLSDGTGDEIATAVSGGTLTVRRADEGTGFHAASASGGGCQLDASGGQACWPAFVVALLLVAHRRMARRIRSAGGPEWSRRTA